MKQNNRESELQTEPTKCLYCGKPFTSENVYSADGWKEVKISGVCELCFDDCTKEEV